MSEASKENGNRSAFPNEEIYGMTKRELIAMGQMKAWRSIFPGMEANRIARDAVKDADALLEALE